MGFVTGEHTLSKNWRICVICNGRYHRTGNRDFKTCSMACKAKYNTLIMTGRPQKREGTMIPCKTCGMQFYVSPGQLVHSRPSRGKSSPRKYCSQKCRYADPDFSAPVRGENNWNWKGGRVKCQGYVYVKSHDHPNKNNQGYVMEHRLVMEKKLGRYLLPNEEVHHINAIKDDNSLDNLEIVVKDRHFGEVRCPHCLKGFKVK